MQPVVAQVLLLLEWLYDVVPDETSRQIVASEPQAERLARFALDKLTGMAEPSDSTVGERVKFFRYHRCLARRHGLRARLAAALSLYFTRPGDLLEWRLPAFILCVWPLVRLIGFLQRRWLNRGRRESSKPPQRHLA